MLWRSGTSPPFPDLNGRMRRGTRVIPPRIDPESAIFPSELLSFDPRVDQDSYKGIAGNSGIGPIPIAGAILLADFSNRLEAVTKRQLPRCVFVAAWTLCRSYQTTNRQQKTTSKILEDTGLRLFQEEIYWKSVSTPEPANPHCSCMLRRSKPVYSAALSG